MNQDPNTLARAPDAAEPARTPQAKPARQLHPAARARIARGLRLLYADVLTQPVPDAFQALVADLAARLEEPR